jgi:RNA-directed DNA polymerase
MLICNESDMPTRDCGKYCKKFFYMNKLKLYRPSFQASIGKWSTISWGPIRERVLKLQRIIYNASLSGNIRKVRRFQNLLINSSDAKLLAIRRVTQDNTGKCTAGVDRIKNLNPIQRLRLINKLSVFTRSLPLRRVWIPKPGKTELRPLGIPTIFDRCLQALFKLILEPEWEAKFEFNSYGFRPGRSCRDALAAIQGYVQKRAKYVIDADISKCFDLINHEVLLDKIGMKGRFRKQLRNWLKCGVLDGNTFSDTESGTPQGGVISPLLANIALHGMENHLKEFVKRFPMTYASGALIKIGRRAETLGVVRYADDFVILHHDKKVLLACYSEVKNWLSTVGLSISLSKTRLTHTLELQATDVLDEGFDGKTGFNFLGYTIKQFKTKYQSSKGTTGEFLGFKTLIYPSKKSINNYQVKLHDLILVKGKGMNQAGLISKLNPVIRGWANYFGAFDSNTMGFLTKMDYFTYLKLRKWAKRIKGTTGKGLSYFITVGNDRWTFAILKGPSLLKHFKFATAGARIVKVRSSESPYSGNESYWTKRLLVKPAMNTRVKILFSKQKGFCTWCKRRFRWDDLLEVDHIIALRNGGSSDFVNLQLLHRHCHDSKTALDMAVARAKVKDRTGGQTSTES